MPEFRSRTDRSAEAGFAFESELPVGSLLAMVPFVRGALAIRRSLDDATFPDGAVCSYRLQADIRARTFRVESTWTDEAAFRSWVGAEPHRSVMASLRRRVSGGTFESGPLPRHPS